MPKNKKTTKEERDREIALLIEEERKKFREEKEYESKKVFITKTFDLMVYMFAYEHLRPKYAFDTAKYLIDNSGLLDVDKDLLAMSFAEGIIFSGGGVKEEDWLAVREAIAGIKAILRGQT